MGLRASPLHLGRRPETYCGNREDAISKIGTHSNFVERSVVAAIAGGYVTPLGQCAPSELLHRLLFVFGAGIGFGNNHADVITHGSYKQTEKYQDHLRFSVHPMIATSRKMWHRKTPNRTDDNFA